MKVEERREMGVDKLSIILLKSTKEKRSYVEVVGYTKAKGMGQSDNIQNMTVISMGDLKHLVVAKFKEGIVVDDIVKGMEKLVSEIKHIKSFEWGHDIESEEMLRQGFTHVFTFTFSNSDDFTSYIGHPSHVEFAATFSSAVEKILVFDFSPVVVKAPA